MFRRLQGRRSGQTLIEALMALGVVTTAFLGITALLSKSFFYHRVTSDELAATYLASEGIELAKNLIDHDMYAGNPLGTCLPAGDFMLDYTTDCTNLQVFNGNVTLVFDENTGRYSYHAPAVPVATPFTRRIRVAVDGASTTVQSIVTWSTGPVTSQSVNVEDHFYDWRR